MAGSQLKSLTTSVQFVKGIGEKRGLCLKEIAVETVWDLFYYFPRRYLDRSHIPAIRDLRENTTATVVGTVQFCGIKQGKRKRFELVLFDGTGYLNCIWFNQVHFWQKLFEKGEMLAVNGKVGYFRDLQMVHPDFDRLSDSGDDDFLNTGRIIPLYPSSESLGKAGLDSRGFRRIIRAALQAYAGEIEETLPPAIKKRQQLIGLQTALQHVHFPASKEMLRDARRRLKFDELFYLELMLAYRKRNLETRGKGIGFLKVGDRTRQLIAELPYELTAAQKRVIREIRDDMKREAPMNRLVQGDVGSGKTVVALVSMMMALENGYQAALMAPTEILAEQHYLTVHELLESIGVHVVLLVGGQPSAERQEILAEIKSGKAAIVVGTHALIQQAVEYQKLGLVVIDEQHRFGVLQRATLIDKGATPDVLVMTATPIPRTLSLTLYGDLNVSTIDELPPGRRPVKTHWRGDKKRNEVYRFVRDRVRGGDQAYVIFPLIEESEKIDLQAAIENFETMKAGIFAEFRIGLLHGRMNSAEKENTMRRFKSAEIDVLVSTTVIEVGVDVPNATIMVIENAERFGLPQLHQLRGRVGRGVKESFCFLIARYPISDDAKKRLTALSESNDGFRIAEVDLQIRGPGEFFGTRQSGMPELRIADIVKDTELLIQARDEAFEFAENAPMKAEGKLPVRAHFFKNYREKFELASVG